MPPDRPTVGDFLPDFVQSAFFGIGAPRAAPRGHRQANKEINSGLADPRIKARLAAIAGNPSRLARRLWQAYCRGNRQMEQGNQLVGIKPE
jgi:hypothetical protein